MKTTQQLAIAAALLFIGGAAIAPASIAALPGRLDLAQESKIWLEGDSTLHAYKSTATQYRITVAAATPGADQVRFSDLEVVIPVKSLKSGDGNLDGNMYKALMADRHATIRFKSSGGTFSVSKDGKVTGDIVGRLAIAGTEKETRIQAAGVLKGDTLRLKGSKALSMTAFGVTPPVLLGGVIKTDDQIVVHYDLVGTVKD